MLNCGVEQLGTGQVQPYLKKARCRQLWGGAAGQQLNIIGPREGWDAPSCGEGQLGNGHV